MIRHSRQRPLSQGFIHGDVKPLNVVRVKSAEGHGGGSADSEWLIIDLDAAAALGSGYVGLKSSTAVRRCPVRERLWNWQRWPATKAHANTQRGALQL